MFTALFTVLLSIATTLVKPTEICMMPLYFCMVQFEISSGCLQLTKCVKHNQGKDELEES